MKVVSFFLKPLSLSRSSISSIRECSRNQRTAQPASLAFVSPCLRSAQTLRRRSLNGSDGTRFHKCRVIHELSSRSARKQSANETAFAPAIQTGIPSDRPRWERLISSTFACFSMSTCNIISSSTLSAAGKYRLLDRNFDPDPRHRLRSPSSFVSFGES